MLPIIQPKELILLKQKQELVLIDARSGPDAREKYRMLHLAGALHVDLEQDLADTVFNAAEGGRHPLPEINKFTQLLGQLGIDVESHVVVYDDKNGANAAARFWWMLTSVGHTQVQVLDGGMQAALKAGFPTSSAKEKPVAKPAYPCSNWLLTTVDIDQVEKATQDDAYLIIDVREAPRYRGETEPIDLVAGHIPGAINIAYTSNLDSNGDYLSAQELKSKYGQVIGNRTPDQVIVHCGSGVTACHTLLAMAYAGMHIPQLYVGSWSEWSRRNLPIAREI
jgi:thiosulfate/3-mercaptopyruvate sulfurtransferase